MNMERATEALQRYFGYDAFRLNQAEVIERTLNQANSLVVMPTGGGKSMCYQIPAILFEGVTVVISPLIALMADQVAGLLANGVTAAALNSQCSAQDAADIQARVASGDLRLLYVSPERAVSPGFLHWISQQPVTQIAIDEAHCVSIWGNDFRPEYTRLTELTALFPNAPVAALTATADTSTQQDIRQRLDLDRGGSQACQTFVSSFERKNIFLEVQPASGRLNMIRRFLHDHKGQAGIIYCLSRKSTEDLAYKLRQEGYSAAYYHGSMAADERARIQTAFLKDDIQIICATIAFGMGIDKPNIRWVIHYNLPKNIESYYQEIGRAGRDGEPSEALLFASYGDIKTLTQFIENGEGSEQFKAVQMAKQARMWDFTQSQACRTRFILNYFGEYREADCGHCDHCLNPPQTIDGTEIAQKALSAVHWLREQVGMNMLVNVLRGSSNAELRHKGYDQIRTWGAGKDIPWKAWRHYITQLVDQGYLSIDFTQSNNLKKTEHSMAVLRGQVPVALCEYQEPGETPITREKALKPTGAQLTEVDQVLFEALRQLRARLADEAGIPPFAVFSDVSLQEMAQLKPANEAAFMRVHGVGEHKNRIYGEVFMDCIRQQVPEDQWFVSSEPVKRAPPRNEFTIPKLSGTHWETLALYQQGLSIEAIARQRELSETTIQGHLLRLNYHGEPVDISSIVSDDQIRRIQERWLQSGKPIQIYVVADQIGEGIPHDHIRYAVCLLKRLD